MRCLDWTAIVVFGLVGCGPVKGDTDATDTGGTTQGATDPPGDEASASDPPASAPTSSGTDAPDATTVETEGSTVGTEGDGTTTGGEGTSSSGTGDESAGFIVEDTDLPECDDEMDGLRLSLCDPWVQDCPDGDKCAPANTGCGEPDTWSSWACVPVVEDAAPVGAPCTAQTPFSGRDDCELGALCWDLDDQLKGTCVALCDGSPEAPVCAAGTSCFQGEDGVLTVCLADCDPLADDCGADAACVPADAAWVCMLQAAPGAAFAACEGADQCADGLACADPAGIDACPPGAVGCCLPLCDLGAPACPDATPTCASWYAPDPPPAGLESVGVCGP